MKKLFFTFISTAMLATPVQATESIRDPVVSIKMDWSDPVWSDGKWNVFKYTKERTCDLGRSIDTSYVTINYNHSTNRYIFGFISEFTKVDSSPNNITLIMDFSYNSTKTEFHKSLIDFQKSEGRMYALQLKEEFSEDFSRSNSMEITDTAGNVALAIPDMRGSALAITALKKCSASVAQTLPVQRRATKADIPRPATASQRASIIKAVSQNLRDPISAQYGQITVFRDRACATVNAKNGFGGYTGDQQAMVAYNDHTGEWLEIMINAVSHSTCILSFVLADYR